MAKPLRSDVVVNPQELQFKHFGVLDAGAQSKSSVLTSVTINVLLGIVVIIVGAAAKKVADHNKLTAIVEPISLKEPLPEPVRPKIVPPKPKVLPKPPIVPPEPKIKVPEVKVPDVPRPVAPRVPQQPVVLTPAPPKLVVAPAAPKAVSLARPAPAAVVNQVPQPTAIRLGSMDNPIKNTSGPAVSNINLGRAGAPGMQASNTGLGSPTKVNLGGNGSPNSGSTTGSGVVAVTGIPHGVTGGTGNNNSRGTVAGPVNLGVAQTVQSVRLPAAAAPTVRTGPKVLFKPAPVYTEEAKSMHLSGAVSIRIRVSSSGSVTVLGVTNGLGHGLDESAIRAIQGTRFAPAVDASGHPIDWEGVVNVNFQLAE